MSSLAFFRTPCICDPFPPRTSSSQCRKLLHLSLAIAVRSRRAYSAKGTAKRAIPKRVERFWMPSSMSVVQAAKQLADTAPYGPDWELFKPMMVTGKSILTESVENVIWNKSVKEGAPIVARDAAKLAGQGLRPDSPGELGMLAETSGSPFQTTQTACCMLQDPRWRPVGAWLLAVATARRDSLAILLQSFWYLNPTFDRTGGFLMSAHTALEYLDVLASSDMDWRALVLRAQILSASKKHDQALALAQRAVELTEAQLDAKGLNEAEPYGKPWTLDQITAPWKTLYDVAHNAGKRDLMIEAIKAGSEKYGDPKTWREMARLEIDLVQDLDIPAYSRQWLKFKSNIAMTGDVQTTGTSKAAFDIGKYHLEKDGLYPPNRDASKSPRITRQCEGFDWFAVAAELSLSATATCYAVVFPALLLRESGFVDEGKALVSKLVERWEYEELKDKDRTEALKLLHVYLEQWCPPGSEQGRFPTAFDFGREPLWSSSAER